MAVYSTLRTVYEFELKMLVRDRRTILASIVLPILVMPLFFLASSFNERLRQQRIEEEVFTYAVSPAASKVVDDLLGEVADVAGTSEESPLDESSTIRLERSESDDATTDLEEQSIHLYVDLEESRVGDDETVELPNDETVELPNDETVELPNDELPVIILVHRADWDASSTATGEMEKRLDEGRRRVRAAALRASGFPIAESQVAVLEKEDLATDEQLAGATLGRFATLFVMLFLLTGGSVVAADSIAGEKERGTLETLLTTAATRDEIVRAKQLVILTVGFVITVIQLLNFAVYVGFELIELPAGLDVDLTIGKAVLLLILFLPMAAIAANTLLLASGLSRTYKEFQVYFLPVFLLLLLPAAASLLPGVELRSALVLVPLANLAVGVREVLVGTLDWPMLTLAIAISSSAAYVLGRATSRALSTERLITASDYGRAEFEGGVALFRRHVVRWFALMWVVLFLASSSGALGSSLERQLAFNLVVLFLGGSLLIIKLYRLPIRETLRLRSASPMIWLAVVIGAPAWFMTTVAIGKLSFWLFPLPSQMLEEFTKLVVPSEMPLWKILMLVAVLPGICEEIAFRGVLLSSLDRKRLWVRCLIVGLVFGFFHFQLVRFLPTATLGALLVVVTVWSGSLFPAMLWHALNNGSAIIADRLGLAVAEFPGSVFVASSLVTALSVWLLWRHRLVEDGDP